MKTQNLLVVDWDYFFPTSEGNPDVTAEEFFLWDWGHAETAIHLGAVWVTRAAEFDRANVPRPQMNLEWTDWWHRFDIDPLATLYYAESNALAFNPKVRESRGAQRTAQVWLFDAHHDSGYPPNTIQSIMKSNRVSCEDWMVGYRYREQAELHVRYPNWKTWAFDVEPETVLPKVDRAFDNFLPLDVRFDTVFVCRSGAWVPPWCDGEFDQFINDAPVNCMVELDPTPPRTWNEDDVKNLKLAYEKLDRMRREDPEPPQEPS